MSNEKPVELTALRRIISDPGAIVPRGDDFTESIPQWSARAVLASGWVSPEEAKAREAAAPREALLRYDRAVAMAREANAAAIEHWNRADKAEAKVARAIEWARAEVGDQRSEDLLTALAEPEREEEGDFPSEVARALLDDERLSDEASGR